MKMCCLMTKPTDFKWKHYQPEIILLTVRNCLVALKTQNKYTLVLDAPNATDLMKVVASPFNGSTNQKFKLNKLS
ncbi:hypothetical protein ACQVTS_30165 [Bacillus mycoides]|uniref:hypothetical protein n=1 Tax=Bacillus mycoides TaxID=1405 RepID=UPI003D649DEE